MIKVLRDLGLFPLNRVSAILSGAFTPQYILFEHRYHIGTPQIEELPQKCSDLVYFAGFLTLYFTIDI